MLPSKILLTGAQPGPCHFSFLCVHLADDLFSVSAALAHFQHHLIPDDKY